MSWTKRILLVDDDPGILETLRIVLTADGFEIEMAWSSEEACTLLNQAHFDLLVTDFNMPGMKGDELALLVKKQWPGTPVIMLSGSAESLRRSGKMLSGVDALLNKPFDLFRFRREVAWLLEEEAAFTILGNKATGAGKKYGKASLRKY